ncbi:MAG TPA: hypothetical protein VEL03_14730 [Streptosporangiaceae bacterium]|nr:hypothetical protein [Streptosporangiaceae bacterium]
MAAGDATQITADTGGRIGGPGSHVPRPRLRGLECFLVLLLCLAVLEVHDVGYLLSQPYWNDEAWVAVTARFPLSQLPALTSTTPIGWSFLLRLVTVGHSQSGRLLPLAFAAAAVAPAYWLARRLAWKRATSSVLAGLLAAASVLLVPAMLVRDDLKQYTADAFIGLLVLATASRLERQWSRRGLLLLSTAVWAGMLVSDAAAFVGAAALAAICLTQLASRAWRRLAEAVVVTAGTGVLSLGVYEVFYARAVVPGLVAYWQAVGSYPPRHGGLRTAYAFVIRRFDDYHSYFGLGPAWLAIPLVLAGLLTVGRLGRPATAVAIAVLWPEMLALSALRKYPFLDLRTSTFLFAITAVTAAIGVAGICGALASWLRRAAIATTVTAVLAGVALALFGVAVAPYVRSHQIPLEDIRQQTAYVAAHAAPGDPIVVSSNSNWGFAYYWPRGQPAHRPDTANLQGYEAYFPGQPRIIVATNRDAAAIGTAMRQALAEVTPGTCARVWLVRTHVSTGERAAWIAVLGALRLTAKVLPDGVAYIERGPPPCRGA